MTVYVEYVIIDNLIIDYLLLRATFALTALNPSRRRLFLCSLLGAMVALVYPLVSQNQLLSIVIRLLTGCLMVVLAYNFNCFRAFFINLVIFVCLTFLTGGAIIGIYNIFDLDYSSEISIALMFLPVYLIIKVISSVMHYVYSQKTVVSNLFETEISLNGKVVKCKGFMDTGNAVYYQNRPVIVCGKQFFNQFIDQNFYKIKTTKITLTTVSGQTQCLAVEMEKIVIYFSDKPNIYNNVMLCVAQNVGDGYDLILHPAFFKEIEDEKRSVKIKKVS